MKTSPSSTTAYTAIDTWFVFEVGDTTFSYQCDPLQFSCGDPLEYQGYDYETVQIGEQCWFAENLRADFYSNGDAVPTLTLKIGLASEEGYTIVYGSGGSCQHYASFDACNSNLSVEVFGRLYNSYAAQDSRNICPTGWHVANDSDWDALITQYESASELKSIEGWYENGFGSGSNISGFNAQPGGYLYEGNYLFAGSHGYWWTTTQGVGPNIETKVIASSIDYVQTIDYGPNHGFSIRCLKDTE